MDHGASAQAGCVCPNHNASMNSAMSSPSAHWSQFMSAAGLDRHVYPLREVVAPEPLARVNLRHAALHGEWIYSIQPNG